MTDQQSPIVSTDHGRQNSQPRPCHPIEKAEQFCIEARSPPKKIEEFIGQVNSQTDDLSVARMTSPAGWVEPGQAPEFDEFTVVLRSLLRIESKTGMLEIPAGSAVIMHNGEWVRYSTPQGAENIVVCLLAVSPATLRRDA